MTWGKGVHRAAVVPQAPQAKPCPTCYAPMGKQGRGKSERWECAKHGAPRKP